MEKLKIKKKRIRIAQRVCRTCKVIDMTGKLGLRCEPCKALRKEEYKKEWMEKNIVSFRAKRAAYNRQLRQERFKLKLCPECNGPIEWRKIKRCEACRIKKEENRAKLRVSTEDGRMRSRAAIRKSYAKNRDSILHKQLLERIKKNVESGKFLFIPEPKLPRKRPKNEAYKRKLEKKKQWRKDNYEEYTSKRKTYYANNKEKIQNYYKQRRKTDIHHRIRCRLSIRIANLLRGKGKTIGTIELTGCSLKELKNHLEKRFFLGMNWNNWGVGKLIRNENGILVPNEKWQIDHIIPCESFDLTKEEEQRKCFHYSNLQPLWWWDNLDKSNRLDFFWDTSTLSECVDELCDIS